MGLFINFFDKEIKNIYEKKNFSENVLKYLGSRQLAGKSKTNKIPFKSHPIYLKN